MTIKNKSTEKTKMTRIAGGVYEREFLAKDVEVPLKGFSERPINRLVSSKPIPNILNIEANHLTRNLKRDERDIVPLLDYQMWLEAGKLDKANFKALAADPAVSFDSNIWRNFRNLAGVMGQRKSTVSEAISEMYPINIPAPSQVGSHTLAKYYEENKKYLFKAQKNFSQAVAKAEKDATIMKFLRLKSEMRNPPMDWDGNIVPPRNFVKYPPTSRSRLLDPVTMSSDNVSYPNLDSASLNNPSEFMHGATTVTKINLDMSAKNLELKPTINRVRPSKLVFRKTHPNFNKVILEQQIKGIYKLANANKDI